MHIRLVKVKENFQFLLGVHLRSWGPLGTELGCLFHRDGVLSYPHLQLFLPGFGLAELAPCLVA